MPPHIALPKITSHLNSPAFCTQAGIPGTGLLYHKDTLTEPNAEIKEHLMGSNQEPQLLHAYQKSTDAKYSDKHRTSTY